MKKYDVVRLTTENAKDFVAFIGAENAENVGKSGYFGRGVTDDGRPCGAMLLLQSEDREHVSFVAGSVSPEAEAEGAGDLLKHDLGEFLAASDVSSVEPMDSKNTDISLYLPRLNAIAAAFSNQDLEARVAGLTGSAGIPFVSVTNALVTVNFFISIDEDDFESALLIASTGADEYDRFTSLTGDVAYVKNGLYTAVLPIYGVPPEEVILAFYAEFVYEVLYGDEIYDEAAVYDEEDLGEKLDILADGLAEIGFSATPYLAGDDSGVMLLDENLSSDEDGTGVEPVLLSIKPLKSSDIILDENVVLLNIKRHVSFSDEDAAQGAMERFGSKNRTIRAYVHENEMDFYCAFPISTNDISLLHVLGTAIDTLVKESDECLVER